MSQIHKQFKINIHESAFLNCFILSGLLKVDPAFFLKIVQRACDHYQLFFPYVKIAFGSFNIEMSQYVANINCIDPFFK